jgi:hypothetical protein
MKCRMEQRLHRDGGAGVIEMQLRILAAALLVTLLALTACGSKATAGSRSDSPATGTPSGADAFTDSAYSPPYAVDANGFDPANFGPDSADIDNRYLPFEPGTQFVYHGSSVEDGERLPHQVIFTVTDLTKVIAGVRTLVGWDRDLSDGVVREAELIFYAQDKDGNVWHLGQYPEIYDEDQFDGAAPWLVGYVKGAKAGIMMLAEPRLGDPAYSEGFAPPPYFWDDVAEVYKTGQETCVPVDCYTDVLVTQESEPSKPGAFQLKFYAPGVGYVRVGWRGPNEEEREVLVLAERRHLDADAMAEVRAEAFAMEARASVYGLTQPAEPRS